MPTFARFISRHRWPVIGVWIVLTLIGLVTSGRLSDRWYQGSAVPGAPAYEAGQRTLDTFGAGVRAPNVIVVSGEVDEIGPAVRRAAATTRGARTRSANTPAAGTPA